MDEIPRQAKIPVAGFKKGEQVFFDPPDQAPYDEDIQQSDAPKRKLTPFEILVGQSEEEITEDLDKKEVQGLASMDEHIRQSRYYIRSMRPHPLIRETGAYNPRANFVFPNTQTDRYKDPDSDDDKFFG